MLLPKRVHRRTSNGNGEEKSEDDVYIRNFYERYRVGEMGRGTVRELTLKDVGIITKERTCHVYLLEPLLDGKLKEGYPLDNDFFDSYSRWNSNNPVVYPWDLRVRVYVKTPDDRKWDKIHEQWKKQQDDERRWNDIGSNIGTDAASLFYAAAYPEGRQSVAGLRRVA